MKKCKCGCGGTELNRFGFTSECWSKKIKDGKKKQKPPQDPHSIIVDFSKNTKLLEKLKHAAEVNFRTVQGQILYYIWRSIEFDKDTKPIKIRKETHAEKEDGDVLA